MLKKLICLFNWQPIKKSSKTTFWTRNSYYEVLKVKSIKLNKLLFKTTFKLFGCGDFEALSRVDGSVRGRTNKNDYE